MSNLNKAVSLSMLMLLACMASFLSAGANSRNSTNERRQRELYWSMAQNQEKIRHHLGVMSRFVERMKNVRASSERGRVLDNDQVRMASRFLKQYHPVIFDVMTRLKIQSEKNQADKEEVEKMIEELTAQLQRVISEIMQMLDTAVKSDQDTSDDQS